MHDNNAQAITISKTRQMHLPVDNSVHVDYVKNYIQL